MALGYSVLRTALKRVLLHVIEQVVHLPKGLSHGPVSVLWRHPELRDVQPLQLYMVALAVICAYWYPTL